MDEVTREKLKNSLQLIVNDEVEVDGKIDEEFVQLTINQKIDPEFSSKEVLIQEMALALLQRWFPTRMPVGDDYEKWIEIALEDATAVFDHLVEKEFLIEVENDSNY